MDYSLMNPDHLQQEIADSLKLIEEREMKAQVQLVKIDDIIGYVKDTFNEGEPTTLTVEQVRDILRFLGDIRTELYVPAHKDKFYVRVLEHLQKDRRWRIGSRLKFLR